MISRVCVLAILLTLSGIAYSQTVPAGIGNSDGSNGQPRNILWLDASSLSLTDGSDVTTWADLSGNGNDATASVGQYPIFVQNYANINNKSLVQFDGSTQFMSLASNLGTSANGIVGDDFACIMVVGKPNTSGNWLMGGNPGGPSGGNLHVGWRNNTTFAFGFWGNDVNGTSSGSVNQPSIYYMGLNSSASPSRTLYENGSLLNSSTNTNTLSQWASPTIGKMGNTYWGRGQIAEIIIYKGVINNAQRVIIDNYLANKYGLTLSSSNLYTNSNYQSDITAIGQDSGDSYTSASSAGFYVNENGALDNGDFIFFAHNGTSNDTPSTADLPGGTEERWARDWYIEKTGSLDVNLIFDLPEGISGDYPADISNYVLLYRSITSGNYSTVSATVAYGENDQVSFSVSNADLVNGYYTLGTTDATDSPVIGKPGLTWYTLTSGDWTDTDVWTLDPSGSLPNNPSSQYPNLESDNVVVKNGKTITVDIDNISCARLTVEGRLALGTTSGHSFTTINGDGRILMQADNFPSGDATHFISEGLGEGTVEFNGGSYSITNARQFFDVEINLSNTSNILTLLNDLTINGDLKIQNGGLKINDNSATTILSLTVNGSVDVQTDGNISVGTGNTIGSYSIPGTMPSSGQYHSIFHQFYVGGNFINRGTVRLTNLNAPTYNQFASNGAATLRFTGASDNTFYCYNTTDLYNLVIDKGSDRTYILEVYADDTSYFRLFGPNNYGRNTSSPFSSADPEVRKALWIYHGTLKLTGSVYIPSLSEGSLGGGNGDYTIGYSAKLWIAGDDVEVYSTARNSDEVPGFTSSDTYTAVGVSSSGSNSALTLLGGFRIDGGVFDTDNSYGFVFWDSANPIAEINGGVVNVEKLYQVGSGTVTYRQTGGHLTKNGGDDFDLSNTEAVFNMSGGTIEIQTGDFLIGSKEGNYNVTGGTVIVKQNGGSSPIVNTTAPIYNFSVERLNSSGTTTIDLQNELAVLNDLTINANTFFDHNGNNVSVGRNMSINENAAQVGTNNYGYLYSSSETNTTTFNGTENGTLYIGFSTPDNGYELYFHNLVIDKPSGKSLTLTGDVEKTAQYQEDNGYAHHRCKLFQVVNNFTIESGLFNQGEHSIRLFGPLTVKANGQCGEYIPGTTHLYAMVMLKDANLNITTEEGAVFGNIKVNPADPTDNIAFSSDVYIKRISYFHGSFNLGTYNLKVDYLHDELTENNFDISDGDVNEQMFYTAGNASDGGVSILIPEGTADNTAFGFPIGVSSKYTPAEIHIGDVPTGGGYVQINPVQGELQTTDLSGGDLLNYYWRVRHERFATLPTIKYRFEYDDADVVGTESNYYPGKVLGETPYTRSYINDQSNVDNSNNSITYDDGSGGRITLEIANFSAGDNNRFVGAPTIYYSRISSFGWYNRYWEDGNNWSTVAHDGSTDNSARPAAGTWPQSGDVAVIGYGGTGSATQQHSITIRDGRTVDVAEVVYDNPHGNGCRLVLMRNATISFSKISGTGGTFMQRLQSSDNPSITGDFGDFYTNNNFTYGYYLDANGTYNITPPTNQFPSLRIEGGNSNKIAIFQTDIIVNNNMKVDGSTTLRTNNGANGDIEVKGQLRIGGYLGGNIQFNDQNARIIETNDLLFNGSSGTTNLSVLNTTASGLEHRLIVNGDISQDDPGVFDLYNGNGASDNNVILELAGEGSNTYTRTAGDIPSLYRLVVNKGDGTSNSFSFDSEVTVNGVTSGVGEDKAVEIQNGTLILNNSNIDINLTTGDDYFSIPSSGALEVTQGTVTASGNSGISLDGKLLISGGEVDMSGGNNPIEYSASGSAEIEITSGTLTVGSQIRRALLTDDGVLTYNQSGGTVIVGEYSAPENDRGVLEVLGTGSHFEHTGGTLQIANGQSSPSIASVYLNPETSSVASGTTLTFDPVQSSGINEIGIYSTVALKNLLLVNDANLNVKQWTVPLIVEGDFNIESNATFNANGQSLSIGGDFTMSGGFSHGNNTTTLTGASNQIITGDVTFYNLTKSGTNELSLHVGDTEITVENILDFQDGTLNDNSNNVYVQGYCTFAGTHVYGGAGNGLILNGSSGQELSGGGVLGMLTINNTAGVDVPLGNEFTINNKLRLEAGIFNIDKNMLLLTEDCIVEHGVDDFSNTNMIQNNISFTDNGVTKVFPQVTSGVDAVYNFTFPMGSGGKYTPVSVAITNNDNNSGSLTVKPANEYHPSVVDQDNVLQYHWELSASGISGFESEVRLKYEAADALVDAPNDITDYYTARLLSDGTGDWNKFSGAAVVDEVANELVFDFLGTNDAGISGAYTAGLDAAIPDQVPGYITITDGNWTDETIWDTYPTSGGTVPAGGPRGSMVYISHVVDVPSNFLSVYRTTINSGGTLNIGSTFGHRVGNVSGSGTLKLSDQGSLPAGVFNEFFVVTGGTLEYTGTTNYDFLSDINSLNNLVLSGSGERRFPNLDLTILGDLTIDGVDAINEHDRDLYLKGDIDFLSGTFDSGTGNSTVTFNGSGIQYANGPGEFTNTNSFNNLVINKSGNINVNTGIDVDNVLTLTSGIINNSFGEDFRIISSNESAVVGGSESSYVQGSMIKKINNGGTFEFPIGDANRFGKIKVFATQTSGAQDWKVTYNNSNPTSAGYDSDIFDPAGDLDYVSKNEYWTVEAPSNGSKAKVTLTWDSQSGVTPDSDFRAVQWANLSPDSWQEISITGLTGTSSSGSVSSASTITFNEVSGSGFDGNVFTFGSISVPMFDWTGVAGGDETNWFNPANWASGTVPAAGTDITITSSTPQPIVDPSKSSAVAQANNLTIESGATLTLMPGSRFTVNGDLVTNDDNGLVIQNSNSLPTSFIVNGTTSGNVKFEWTYDANRYWYIGHSISNPVISSYDNIVGGSNDYKLYRYTGRWTNISKTAYDFTGKPLEGYAVKFNEQTTVTHIGSLNNNAQYTRSIGWGFNLLANPFPSYLDLSDIGQWNFGTALLTVYTRTTLPGDIRGYAAYNMASNEGVNGGSQYVAPGQAFYVYNQSGNFDFEVNASTKIHTSGVALKVSGSDMRDDVIRFEMNNGITTDQSAIVFRSLGSFDMTQNDTEKRMENNGVVPNVYSLKGSKNVAINLLPEVENVVSVPIGYKLGSKGVGVSTLRFTNIKDFQPGVPVYLFDHSTGEKINLREEPIYEFMAEAGTVNERFEIVFESPITTDVSESIKSENNIDVYAYYSNGELTIVENLIQEGEVGTIQIQVTDVSGKLYHSSEYKQSGKHKITEEFAQGIYLVVVSNQNKGKYTCKVIIPE